MATVKLFSFRINNIAYKNVQPFLIELTEKKIPLIIFWICFLLRIPTVKSRWIIKFTYKDENLDHKCDSIYFDTKEDAQYWYNFIFEAVFLERSLNAYPIPTPKKPNLPPQKTKKPPERLKKPNHLKVVKDGQETKTPPPKE